MKTWELIKLATEKPKIKARMINYNEMLEEYGQQVEGYSAVLEFGGKLCGMDGYCLKMSHAIINEAEWELIRSQVNFVDAVKAYIDDKVVYCEIDNKRYTYSKFSGNVYNEMVCDGVAGVSPAEIIYGKWYIEE